MAYDMSLVSAGFSAVGSAMVAGYNNSANKAIADAENRIRAGNNQVLAAANARNAQGSALARWKQSVSNQRVYEGIGNNQEALAVNYNRMRDQKTRANFSANIQAAEEQGRQQASAAASGVTGSVVDVIDMTSKLKTSMQNVATKQAEAQTVFDFGKRQNQMRLAGDDQIDYSLIFDSNYRMDTGNSVAQQTNLLGAFLGDEKRVTKFSNGLANFNFSFGSSDNTQLATGDFSRMDRASYTE